MSLSTTTNKIVFDGNGSATTFASGFRVPDAPSLAVIFTDAHGIDTTLNPAAYSVTGFNALTGITVTYPLAGSPIATGTKLTILRMLPLTQPTVFSNQGSYLPSVVETSLDRVTMMQQQLSELIERAIVVSPSDDAPSALPGAAARANLALIFDADGNPTVGAGTGGGGGTGTVTRVSVSAGANITASVDTSTTTPVIHVAVPAAVTGVTVNGLTFTALSTGFAVAGGTTSRTLTVDANFSTSSGGGGGITSLTGDVTGSGSGAVATTIANLAVTNAKIAASTIDLTAKVTGTLPAANGGTGVASYTVGDILYASATTTLSKLADVATGNALISGGTTTAPAWGKIGLTTHVSGTLPVANGGTGVTSGTFVTTTGAQTVDGKTLTGITGITQSIGSASISGSTLTLDVGAKSVYVVTVNHDFSITFTNAVAGSQVTVIFLGNGSSFVPTFNADFGDAGDPTLSTGSGVETHVEFTTRDGSNWRGFTGGTGFGP